jgi:proliferating cell nuclear antigen PCNA
MSYIVKVVTEHAKDLKILFDVLREVLHEFKLQFIKNDEVKNGVKDGEIKQCTGGIKIFELDEYQTLFIFVKLNADQFAEFKVKYPTHIVGLDLVQLHRYLKTIDDKDTIMTIYIDKDDSQNIVFETENKSKNSSSKYSQKILDLDEDNGGMPKNIESDLVVTMETSDFHKICREMSNFADCMAITCTSKKIIFKCDGDTMSYTKVFNNTGGEDGVDIFIANEKNKDIIVNAIFELKYLMTFNKCVSLCSKIQIYLRNGNCPMIINYTVATLGQMIVGLSPIDEQSIKRNVDYDEELEKTYKTNNKVELK